VITKLIYRLLISCTGAIYCTAVTSYCPQPKTTPSTPIFPSGLKALGKYEAFRSNFGLEQYDVITVRYFCCLNRTIALYNSPYLYQCQKTCQFKTWCKGDKSNIENSTDNFCEDIRQNALAALTNLGHVTPFLLLVPPHHLTIQWVREITSLDSKLPDQTEVHVITDLGSDPLAERNRSHSSRRLFAQGHR